MQHSGICTSWNIQNIEYLIDQDIRSIWDLHTVWNII